MNKFINAHFIAAFIAVSRTQNYSCPTSLGLYPKKINMITKLVSNHVDLFVFVNHRSKRTTCLLDHSKVSYLIYLVTYKL